MSEVSLGLISAALLQRDLLLALRLGVGSEIAETITSLTLWTVAASIVAHGITAQPLMRRYLLRARRPGR